MDPSRLLFFFFLFVFFGNISRMKTCALAPGPAAHALGAIRSGNHGGSPRRNSVLSYPSNWLHQMALKRRRVGPRSVSSAAAEVSRWHIWTQKRASCFKKKKKRKSEARRQQCGNDRRFWAESSTAEGFWSKGKARVPEEEGDKLCTNPLPRRKSPARLGSQRPHKVAEM